MLFLNTPSAGLCTSRRWFPRRPSLVCQQANGGLQANQECFVGELALVRLHSAAGLLTIQASSLTFRRPADYDEEIEDLLMFHCLDGDYHDIDLHLYELHLNDDDDLQLATPTMLRVDERQLIWLRGVEERHRPVFINAVAKELTGLLHLGTFALVRENELSKGDKALPAKFVLEIKYLADGSLDKFKAQLVALGYMARAGIGFFATRSPVASLTAIRLIFSIAVYHSTYLLHTDVSSAFCQSKLDTRTRLRFPKGLSLVDDEGSSSIIVLLRKALYGLRQSSQLFNKLLNGC